MDGRVLHTADTPDLGETSAPDAADLDVGVIFTGETDLLPPLLATLAASGTGLRMRLILVDNATGRDLSAWTDLFDETTVIRNDRRLGYADNLNRILDHTSAPYVLLLNTDMRFDPEAQCLARMVRFMEEHPDCGVAGCRLYHADGSYAYPARRFQSLKTIFARRLGLSKWLPNELDRYLYRDQDASSAFDCDWLSGCFLMVSSAAIADVGRIDAGFPKYFEDVDICLRMALAGRRVMFNGETYGYHLEQRASARLFSRDAWLHLRSYLRWLWKWGLMPGRRVERTQPNIEPVCPPASESTRVFSIPGAAAGRKHTRAA